MRLMNLPPVDYGACTQTVTLYHRLPGEDFRCLRKVFAGAFLDISLNRRTDSEGSDYENCFLLVLPSSWQGRPAWVSPADFDRSETLQRTGFTLCPGDKICPGEGPVVGTACQWANLLPQNGFAQVKETACRYWQGRLCHVEAGGTQSLGRSGLPHPRKGSFG